VNIIEADELLVEKLCRGDQLAAPILISVHGDELLGLVRCMAPRLSGLECESVLEKAIVEGINTIGTFESGSAEVFDWFADQSRVQALAWMQTHPRPGTAEADAGSLPPGASDELETADLAAAVGTLHSGDCLMLALRNWQGLTYSTIGELLGLKELTARQKAKRALDRLELALREEGLLGDEDSQPSDASEHKPRSRQMSSSPLKTALWTRGLELFDDATFQRVTELLGHDEQISPQARRWLIVAARRALADSGTDAMGPHTRTRTKSEIS
jgi:DNA-directed RNA polymerase specialized sigma24 family protein